MNEFLKCCMEVAGYHEPIKPFRGTKKPTASESEQSVFILI